MPRMLLEKQGDLRAKSGWDACFLIPSSSENSD